MPTRKSCLKFIVHQIRLLVKYQKGSSTMNNVIIANENVSVKEYKGQRVVTFKDIDTVHQRPSGTARRNFNTNKKHFIEGEDYFKICANEIRTRKIMEISPKVHEDIVLITESGYLMLVKSFTDDLSWDVQRELVKCYFRVKDESTQIVVTQPEYTYINKTYRARPVLTANDIVNLYGINSVTLYNFIKTKLLLGRDYDLLQGEELKEYTKENPSLPRCRKSVFVIYNIGLSRIISYYELDNSKTPSFIVTQRGYVVQADVRQVMEFVRREIKGVEALTYLVESDDSPSNLENYRKILVQKLSNICWWKSDVSLVKLGIHNITGTEIDNIHNAVYGMKY